MAVISEVKCGRCDRRYSGFRSRCPYCGARRNKRGKHADDSENAKAKLIIGVLLIVVLIAATMVLIFTNLPDKTTTTAKTTNSAAPTDASPTYSDAESNNTALEGTNEASAPAATDESASPSIDQNIQIAAVTIIYTGDGKPRTDVSMTVGQSLPFSFTTTPPTTDKVAIWESSNHDVFMVVGGKVTAMGKGTATLKVTVDGVPAKCVIRVKSK